MHRRKFLATAATSVPAVAFAPSVSPPFQTSNKGFVIRAGKRRFDETTLLGGLNPNNIKVSSKDTGNGLTVFEYVGNEKGGPPLHYHLKQDEIFFITYGEYLFKVGDEEHTLSPGDTIFLPRRVPHAFAQLTERGSMLFMFQPSGMMEDFIKALGALQGPPSPAEGAEIFERHEMKIVGPPLSST